jgi:hypothetical protein
VCVARTHHRVRSRLVRSDNARGEVGKCPPDPPSRPAKEKVDEVVLSSLPHLHGLEHGLEGSPALPAQAPLPYDILPTSRPERRQIITLCCMCFGEIVCVVLGRTLAYAVAWYAVTMPTGRWTMYAGSAFTPSGGPRRHSVLLV